MPHSCQAWALPLRRTCLHMRGHAGQVIQAAHLTTGPRRRLPSAARMRALFLAGTAGRTLFLLVHNEILVPVLDVIVLLVGLCAVVLVPVRHNCCERAGRQAGQAQKQWAGSGKLSTVKVGAARLACQACICKFGCCVLGSAPWVGTP